jgi:hypothetical protein
VDEEAQKIKRIHMTEDLEEKQEIPREPQNKSIKVVELEGWESFKETIKNERLNLDKLRENNNGYIPDLLFRGHADAEWKLETTLERHVKDKEYSWEEYYSILKSIEPEVRSFTNNKYKPLKLEVDAKSSTPPGCEFMAYVRHYKFPSPLLDWSKSFDVAAFFAFSNSKEDKNVAIYSCLATKSNGFTFIGSGPFIGYLGPYMESGPRHSKQESQYTYCYKDTSKVEGEVHEKFYVPHEKNIYGQEQDILTKYTIPSEKQKEVLDELRLKDIDAHSLFGDEESLMKGLAHREFNVRK